MWGVSLDQVRNLSNPFRGAVRCEGNILDAKGKFKYSKSSKNEVSSPIF